MRDSQAARQSVELSDVSSNPESFTPCTVLFFVSFFLGRNKGVEISMHIFAGTPGKQVNGRVRGVISIHCLFLR